MLYLNLNDSKKKYYQEFKNSKRVDRFDFDEDDHELDKCSAADSDGGDTGHDASEED